MVEIKAFKDVASLDFGVDERQSEFYRYFLELGKSKFSNVQALTEWLTERQFEINIEGEDAHLRANEHFLPIIPEKPILFFQLADAISLNFLGWIMIVYESELDLNWNTEAPYLE